MKRKWGTEENAVFVNFFKDEISQKKMATGGKLQRAQKLLKGRTIAQIRTRVNNIIKEKQKIRIQKN